MEAFCCSLKCILLISYIQDAYTDTISVIINVKHKEKHRCALHVETKMFWVQNICFCFLKADRHCYFSHTKQSRSAYLWDRRHTRWWCRCKQIAGRRSFHSLGWPAFVRVFAVGATVMAAAPWSQVQTCCCSNILDSLASLEGPAAVKVICCSNVWVSVLNGLLLGSAALTLLTLAGGHRAEEPPLATWGPRYSIAR